MPPPGNLLKSHGWRRLARTGSAYRHFLLGWGSRQRGQVLTGNSRVGSIARTATATEDNGRTDCSFSPRQPQPQAQLLLQFQAQAQAQVRLAGRDRVQESHIHQPVLPLLLIGAVSGFGRPLYPLNPAGGWVGGSTGLPHPPPVRPYAYDLTGEFPVRVQLPALLKSDPEDEPPEPPND